jgi:hypothetical protein
LILERVLPLSAGIQPRGPHVQSLFPTAGRLSAGWAWLQITSINAWRVVMLSRRCVVTSCARRATNCVTQRSISAEKSDPSTRALGHILVEKA